MLALLELLKFSLEAIEFLEKLLCSFIKSFLFAEILLRLVDLFLSYLFRTLNTRFYSFPIRKSTFF